VTDSFEQRVRFEASAPRVYAALMDAAQHAAFTGAPARIDAREGGEFSCHDGRITGRTIELSPDRRIVQAWRVAAWEPGLYTLVAIELEPDGDATRLDLVHSGVPEAFLEHLAGGWHEGYWKPLARYLSEA
jgi:activator of HSP90 ATPase